MIKNSITKLDKNTCKIVEIRQNNLYKNKKQSKFLIIFIILAILLISNTIFDFPYRCSIRDITEIANNIKSHNSFSYQNRKVLNDEYYKKALKNINDESIYLILSNTQTATSKFISIFTKKRFNHISLSFDYNLYTLVSYNGGNNRNPPGLNLEFKNDLVGEDCSSALVYKLRITQKQKMQMLNKVIDIDKVGSSYNLLGLIHNKSIKPNIMYCSQFVYKMLKESGIEYFSIGNNKIKPSDFIEFDYFRNLEFCYEL